MAYRKYPGSKHGVITSKTRTKFIKRFAKVSPGDTFALSILGRTLDGDIQGVYDEIEYGLTSQGKRLAKKLIKNRVGVPR